jgi:hypothetical protein
MSDIGTGHLDEIGYPRDMLELLISTSEEQFKRNAAEKGEGKRWLYEDAPDARWHIWKACDELFQARDYAHSGEPEPAERHFADALNHMLMAMDVTRKGRSLQPETDGGQADE